jgi:hypothetical protein
VLSTPPAFILSQDQTLQLNCSLHSCSKLTIRPNSTSCHYLVFKDQVAAGFCGGVKNLSAGS